MTTVVQPAPDMEAAAQDEPRSLKLPVAAAVLVSAVLSLVTIGRGSFSLDESVSATLARASWHSFTHTILRREANMSFYYLLLRFWTELGHSEAVVRSFSVVASIGAVAAIMVVARQLFDRRTAIIAGVILAIDPLIVVFAQDARGYALSLLLVTASSALFARAVTAGAGWGTWVAYGLVSVLATYTNFWVALVLVGHGASVAFLPPGTAPWRRLVPTAVGLGVLLVPLALLIRTAYEGGVNWAAGSSAGKLFTKVRADVPHPVLDIVIVLVVVLVAAAVAVVRRHPRTTIVVDRWPVMFALCWLVVPVAIVVLLSLAYEPVLVLRYLGICFPPFVILVAFAVSRLKVEVTRLAVAALVVVSGLGLAAWYARGAPEDFRGAVASVAARARPGDGLVVFAPYNRVPVEWYMHDHPVAERRLRPLFPGGPWDTDALRYDTSIPVTETAVHRAVDGYRRVWLVLSAETLYPKQDGDLLAGLRAAGLVPVGIRSFPGVQVAEYSAAGGGGSGSGGAVPVGSVRTTG
ncbi:MAG TPA: glycosyltransferase family 39 protein [Acidimicrobiales bacterium]|nr:glycosyltransferase family 39 protein [Acidimicrobiales bacterium]